MPAEQVRHWWHGVPTVVACPTCGCPIQRLGGGTLADGLRAHNTIVHGATS